VYQNRVKKTSREKNYDFVQHALRNPFVKGKKPSLQNHTTICAYENESDILNNPRSNRNGRTFRRKRACAVEPAAAFFARHNSAGPG
jgi:hypothetical protein